MNNKQVVGIHVHDVGWYITQHAAVRQIGAYLTTNFAGDDHRLAHAAEAQTLTLHT
jgi:hypothetical protein